MSTNSKRSLFVANIWQDHAPHMDPIRREMVLASYPPEEYAARRYGYPGHGSGLVFKVPSDQITVPQFMIPDDWLVSGGLDVGNSNEHATVCMFIAKHPETGVYYIYDEYYKVGFVRTSDHAEAILRKGFNLPISFDYSGNKTNDELTSTRQIYEEQGLDKIYNANKSVTPGLFMLNDLIAKSKLKVMDNCHNWIREYQQYHFKNGKPVKRNDDCIDASRYCLMGFEEIAIPRWQCTDLNDFDKEVAPVLPRYNEDGY